MPTITPAAAASAASSAGFPASVVPIMVAIAMAESSLNTTATHTNSNGSVDYGLWQINTVNADALRLGNWQDPATNARMAKMIYDRQGLKAWTVYNTGAYQKNVSAATGGLGLSISAAGSPTNGGPNTGTGGPITVLPNILPGLGGTPTPEGANGPAASGLPWFLTQETVSRVLWFLLGVLLVVAGMVIVFRRQVGQGIKLASNLTPVGKAASVADLVK